MLKIEGPFGDGAGVGITLRAIGPIDAEEVAEACLGFGCYPPAIPKIVACLKASGRYDCRLQAAWFCAQYLQVTEELARANVALALQEGEKKNPFMERFWGSKYLGG